MDVDLFYNDLIRSALDKQRFIERTWLQERVAAAIAEPACRYLLLTAEPGAGKTAFMAWQADQNPGWLRYFIRRDSQTLLSSGDARSFLFAIGHQLAALHPDLFRSEGLKIVVEQRIGEVIAGGRAAGIQVEDLEISPFYQTALKVEQDVSLVAGELAGLSVKRLVAEERFLSLDNLQYLALLDPAAALLRQDPSERIVILVDALDELRYQAGQESVLAWLAAAPELPGNVRFVLASRPESILDHFRRRQAPWLKSETIDLQSQQVQDDLRRYAEKYISLPAVKRALVAERAAPQDFVERSISRAEGNFQYLEALFRGIDQVLESGDEERRRRLLRGEEIPNGLEELYAFFLTLIKDRAEAKQVPVAGEGAFEVYERSAWRWLLQPVLGVLSVTLEPLELRQISNFANLRVEERWVQDAIEQLGQFLDRENGRFRLYHSTFPEFLTSQRTRERYSECYLDPAEWYRKIAAYYRGKASSWEFVDWRQVDDYGLMHLPVHLFRLSENPRLRPELYGLLCKPYMREKLVRTLSHRAFSSDVDLAIEAATGDHTPDGLAQLARACLVSSTLGSLAESIHPDLLGILALAGQSPAALGYAALIGDPKLRSKAYRLIAEALLRQGELEAGKGVLRQALEAVELTRAPDYTEIAQAFAQAGDTTGLRQTMEKARSLGNPAWRARAVREVAPLLIQAGENDFAWEAAASIEDRDTRASSLCAIAPALAVSGDQGRLLEIIEAAREAGFETFGPSSLSGLAHALAASGDGEGLELAVSEALSFAKAQDKAQALSGIAQALGHAGDGDGLVEVLGKVGEIDDLLWLVKTVNSMAHAFNTAGYRTDALEILDWAEAQTENIEGSLDRAQALSGISRVFSKLREQARAAETAKHALAAALEKDEGFDLEDFTSAFTNLVQVMQGASDPEEINRAMTGFGSTTDFQYRDSTLTEVIQALLEAGEFDLCFPALPDFHSDGVKAAALVDLAKALARDKDIERLGKARQEAENLRDQEHRVTALSGVAGALLEAGDRAAAGKVIEAAVESLERVGQERQKSEALAELIIALIRVEDEKVSLTVRERAVTLAEAIPSEVRRCAVLNELVRDFISRGEDQGAVEIARGSLACAQAIDYESDRVETLTSAVHALSLTNDREGLQRAAEAANAFTNDYYQRKALSGLAQAYARVGEMEKAKEAATQVLASVEENSSDWLPPLDDAAHALAQAGYQEGLERLLEIVQGVEDEQRRNSALSEIAPPLALANDRENLLKSLAIAETIEDEVWAAIARGHVICALLKLEDPLYSEKTLARVLESVDSIGMDYFEGSVLSDLAVACARTGNHDDLDRMLTALDTLADENERASSLTRVAQALAESGDREGTQALIDRTLKTIEEIYYEGDRAFALGRLAQALSQAGEGERAKRAAWQALWSAEELNSGWFRAKTLKEIAQVMAQNGDDEGLNRVSDAAHDIEENEEKAEALVHLAAAHSEAGDPARAMQVLREALPIARLAGRENLFEVLKHSAGILAADNQGQTLWNVFQAVVEVEDWWIEPALSLAF